MQLDIVRKRFLEYMQQNGHAIVPSASLVPKEDSTTLFTGSGMQPLVPFLLGKEHPEGVRIADSQKCFRANDIDEVGDNRHTTFFEMLGNWSLGDYFKEEQIRQCFTFLTNPEKGLGLDPKKLYVTVFAGAPELNIEKDLFSAEIWQQLFAGVGIQAEIAHIGSEEDGDVRGMRGCERIFYYDASKNWWSRAGMPEHMPIGEPGGPDTEVFYDFGEEYTDAAYAHLKPHPNSDSGRFLEICNSVFMEYLRTEEGFIPLPKKNVDFGAGLERFVAATEGTPDLFRCNMFAGVIEFLEQKTSAKQYAEFPEPYRIIADHIRSALFIAAEGITPSNTEQGYVLRRLLRKTIYSLRYQLEIVDVPISEIATHFIDVYKAYYPDLAKSEVMDILTEEEKKFTATLQKGVQQFEKMKSKKAISAEDAFILQSTYGFPFELTVEMAEKEGIILSYDDYKAVMEQHKATSRQGSEKKFKGGLVDTSDMSVKYHTATHLLHQALRDVLGNEVEQRGSNITPERMRFDFTHPQKVGLTELQKIENIVNTKIQASLSVTCEDMSLEQAKQAGAIGLFDYEDIVRVYSVGDYSKEVCGGPHVENTSSLGKFSILKEEAVSSGVRRIRAVLE